MTAFYERREAIKNAINAGDWPAVAESEILAWIAYMERLEADFAAKGEQLVRMIDRWDEAQKALARVKADLDHGRTAIEKLAKNYAGDCDHCPLRGDFVIGCQYCLKPNGCEAAITAWAYDPSVEAMG